MPKSKKNKKKSFAVQSMEMSTAVPEIIAHRMGSFMSAGTEPTDEHHEEFQLMWSEKANAFIDSWQAMALQGIKVNQEITQSFMQAMFTPWWVQDKKSSLTPVKLSVAALSIIDEGMSPFHKQTIFNAKRLKKDS